MADSGLNSVGAMQRLNSADAEFDGSFEPLSRGRANTWHAGLMYQGNEEQQTGSEDNSQCASTEQSTAGEAEFGDLSEPRSIVPRKGVTRRNAWGQQSYSDLIVQAIESYPDQRATLSMIYEWLVRNIPFFSDKGDSNSSAGWKNSIRHNLSLQPRFMRVPNEGTGKSSWWVINHDANKQSKSQPRGRAKTLDTKLYEKQRRNRPKKRAEGPNTPTNSLNSLANSLSSEEAADGFSLLSRLDYRCRANSNASSIGRLSPISATVEDDGVATLQPPPTGAGVPGWEEVGNGSEMDCDMSNDELLKVSESLRLLQSLSDYDAMSTSDWNIPNVPPAVLLPVQRSTAADNHNSSHACQSIDNVYISQGKSGSLSSVTEQRGINRLRTFLNDPTTQQTLSAKPELLARVRQMILDKRMQMLSTLGQQPAQFSNTLPQQLLTGGVISTDGNTRMGNAFDVPAFVDVDGLRAEAEQQVLEHVFSTGELNLDELSYDLNLVGADDLLA